MPKFKLPHLSTPRLNARLLEPSEANMMLAFRLENRDHLGPWEPLRRPEFFTEAYWQLQLQASKREFQQGQSMSLAILNKQETSVLGVCNFSNIVRGTFQSCHLGYALAEQHQGQGLMAEALKPACEFMFEELRLHRIMANYLPRNKRSGELLKKLGFVVEGEARQYLLINGQWEDHVLTSLINPNDLSR